jgi:hypothetical protein
MSVGFLAGPAKVIVLIVDNKIITSKRFISICIVVTFYKFTLSITFIKEWEVPGMGETPK